MDDQLFNDAVAGELRAAQGRKGWSRPRLAQESGIPLGTLRRYMTGERAVPLAEFFTLLRVLGVSLKDFGESVDRAIGDQ